MVDAAVMLTEGDTKMQFMEPATRAFLRCAHAMTGAAEIDRAAAKADTIALLTILQETTQSRAVAERCAKAKAVLG